MSEPSSLSLRKQVCFAVYSTSHAFTRAYRILLEPLGLTYPQFLVLLVLWERDCMRVKEIGAQLYLDSGTLTPLLKRLEVSGYVRRMRDPTDERQVTIMLTPAGQALERKAESIPADLACMMQAERREIEDLIERLGKLRATLQGACGEALVPA